MAVLRIHAPVLGRQERVFEWDGRPITVGRDDTCDVVLLEQAASRHHARFERHGDEVRVIDCDSANGVWVGDARVVGSRALLDGEAVRIGDTTLTLVLDPHRQATLYRTPVAEPLASGPTLAATPTAPAPAPIEPPAPIPPAPVPLRPPVPAPAASSPSAYSLGSEPTLAAQSGPNFLGTHDRSAPSVYSLGEAPTLAPHAEPSGLPRASSESVYSLGHEPTAAREPEAFGALLPSSSSVYSLGHEPPVPTREPGAFVPRPSSASVYSLGDVPLGELRGPDVLPPAPSFDGAASSAGLGVAPPRPGVMPPQPPPPAFVPPQRHGHSASPATSSSWGEWSEPLPSEHRERGRTSGPALWLGVGLLIGGIAAMVIAVVAGYDPSELASSISAAIGGGGVPR